MQHPLQSDPTAKLFTVHTPQDLAPGGLGGGAVQDGEVVVVDGRHRRLVALRVQQALP